jgi:hypothetical protein
VTSEAMDRSAMVVSPAMLDSIDSRRFEPPTVRRKVIEANSAQNRNRNSTKLQVEAQIHDHLAVEVCSLEC